MKTELERIAPMEIEQRSFEMITAELPHPVDDALAPHHQARHPHNGGL